LLVRLLFFLSRLGFVVLLIFKGVVLKYKIVGGKMFKRKIPASVVRQVVVSISMLVGAVFTALMVYVQAATPSVDGALTVTAANSVINQYADITGVNVGTNTITVDNIANLTSGAPVNGGVLAVGDLLMLYQAKGATIDTTNTATYGSVTSYNNAGLYQFGTVQSIAGNAITLTATGGGNCALSAFDPAFSQVIRVPQLSSLTVNAAASVVAAPWNGTVGGVVVASVAGATTLNNATGSINVSNQGFRGGAIDPAPTSAAGAGVISDFVLAISDTAAAKGEGIAAATGGDFGRGAPANGGGGGNGHNAGGGGGANGGAITGYNGTGIKSVATANWAQAWNLESAGFATNVSPGGGRGGYTYSASDQNALTLAPGQAAWAGDQRDNVGGFGGRPLDYTGAAAGRFFFGGGGGTGEYNGGQPNPGGGGGNGGGLVFLITNSVAGTGSILANGQNGTNGTATDAGSGGGAGGGIIIRSNTAVPVGINLTANGGTGGTQPAVANEAEGPGGGGGGGYIAVNGGTKTANGGANGISNSTHVSEFLPNGATSGAAGTTTATPPADNNLPFCFTPRIGVAKTVGTPTVAGANNQFYDIPYTVLVRSYGEDLTSVQINDVLSSITPTGATLDSVTAGPTVTAVTTGSSITANTPANFLTTGNLLTTSAANTLVRQTNGTDGEATITFTLRVRPPSGATSNATIYNNAATGSGVFNGTGGLTINTTDASDNGVALNPDPDGDRQPNEAGENDPTPVNLNVADLSLTKVVNNPSPAVGSNVTFTITVSNAASPGSSNATGVAVADLLPSGYTFVSATPAAAYNSGTGVWTVGALNAGANAALQITATVNASGSYANTAQVSASSLPDPDSIPNNGAAGEDDQATVTVVPLVAPTLGKTFVPGNIAPGQTSVLTISLGNTNASGLTLTQALVDNLPTNVVLATPLSASTTCGGTGLSPAPVAGGTSVTLATGSTIPVGGCTVTLSVTSSVTGLYTNTIPAGTNPNGLNTNGGAAPSASAPLVVLEPAKQVRLLTDADTSGAPSVGDTVQYQIVYSLPTGAPAIPAFQIFDVLPTQVNYVGSSLTVTPSGGTPAQTGALNGGYTGLATTATSAALLTAPVTLQPGGIITATINATINGTSVVGTPFNNTARGTGTGLPAITGNGAGGGLPTDADATPFGTPASALPQPNDNPATTGQPTQVTTAAPNADLVVTKSQPSPATVNPGGTITYTVTVTNNGPATASNVVVTDTLPTGTTFGSASNGGTQAAGVVTWNGTTTPALVSLANGASQTFTVTVTAP
jgi:uncharacterized repeat protein (TIGR01451 family)/fimbrial isopeptide formation D2 family protein